MMKSKKAVVILFAFFAMMISAAAAIFIQQTNTIKSLPDSLSGLLHEVRKPRLKDREGRSITVTYANQWNSGSYAPLHQMPDSLKKLFVFSEDKRFYSHNGVDWLARLHALVQNFFSMKVVRGGSTITEQVVRMIHPRPRTIRSRYLEGLEARMLEQKHSKEDILEFYLNQVPYAANRRGIIQAAEYYFNRSPETLNLKEMMMLVVLVRAPSYYDPYKDEKRIQRPMMVLAKALFEKKMISGEEFSSVANSDLCFEKSVHDVDAAHFARFVYESSGESAWKNKGAIDTTLDASLQGRVESLMDGILQSLSNKKVNNGACLVADHETGEILAWVSRSASSGDRSGKHIDGVTSPRQPGSSLKPFLYALALENGWTLAREIEDAPLSNPVGRGLHTFHNYSRIHYGWVTVREALGNSLNIPAVKAIGFTGHGAYLAKLRDLGFKSLDKPADFYGDGLALGSGEVSLFEMVQAYGVLANRGIFIPLRATEKVLTPRTNRGAPVFSEETASLISNVLADANARKLEFGGNDLLNFPVETAVKTGTSTDYRDAWAMGCNDRYTVGVWMGNLDARPMNGVTGATGPAFLLRSVFAELNRNRDTRPLFLSPKLVRREVFSKQGLMEEKVEWFKKDDEPRELAPGARCEPVKWIRPVNGLEMAMDPRIPDEKEAFEFELGGVSDSDKITWILDGEELKTARGRRHRWFLTRGLHELEARIEKSQSLASEKMDKTTFSVK